MIHLGEFEAGASFSRDIAQPEAKAEAPPPRPILSKSSDGLFVSPSKCFDWSDPYALGILFRSRGRGTEREVRLEGKSFS